MRLQEIEAEVLARETVDWIDGLRRRLGCSLGREASLPRRLDQVDDWLGTDVGLAIYALARYAQTGRLERVAYHPGAGSINLHLETVRIVWEASHPAVFPAFPYPWTIGGTGGSGEPTRPFDVVLCAVMARETLRIGGRISVRELAALGGTSESTVRTTSSRGDGPRVEVGTVAPGLAKAWLLKRGVVGL